MANKDNTTVAIFYGNETASSSDTFRPLALTPVDLIRLCVSTVATGVFLSLSLWTFVDMQSRRKTTSLSNSNVFLLLSSVFGLMSLLETVEFFFIYDHLFYQSLDWAQHHQGLAYFIEYTRLLQQSLVLATGLHQMFCILNCCGGDDFGILVGGRCCRLLLAFNLSLVLPTVAVVISWHQQEANAVDRILYPILVPFTAALIIGGFLLFLARKQLLKMSPYDVLATKLILLFQLLIILQAVESALVEFMYFMAVLDTRKGYIFNTMEDVFRSLYPLSYLILFRHPSFSYRLFQCLHGKDGAHRLPANNDEDENCHEMQQSTNGISLAFPAAALFSVTEEEEEEEDDDRQERDREQLLHTTSMITP